MSDNTKDILDTVRSWLFPIVLSVIAFFVVQYMREQSSKLDEMKVTQYENQKETRQAIEELREDIATMQTKQGIIEYKVDDIKKNLSH